MIRGVAIAQLAVACALGCDRPADGRERAALTARPGQDQEPMACQVLASGALPPALRETSGLARSGLDPSVFWTHNDSGHAPVLFAIDTAGRVIARVQPRGARNMDWEDVASAPCDGGSCLYVADTGDNAGARDRVTIYRVPEPALGSAALVTATRIDLRYPDGARDAEALFALPSGELYLITKGRHGPIVLYRVPGDGAATAFGAPAGEAGASPVVVLEPVRTLGAEPEDGEDRVTGASASPDGARVAIRTERMLWIYDAAALLAGGDATPLSADLAPLGESQGEGVALAADGSIWLTSEAEELGSPRWTRISCARP